MPPYATNSPAMPPAIARMRLSVISWRTKRLRSAPMDSRMAISRLRVRARASNRFATFEHAMIRMSVTSPISILTRASSCGVSRTRRSSSVRTVMRKLRFVFGYSRSRAALMVVSSA